ncbi:Serine protease trypsin-like protein, partial [Phytophthora megakarya]
PVKLAAADDSDFKPEKMATVMGWGLDAEANGTYMHELQRVDVPLVSDEACAAYVAANSAMVCAGGVANYDACDQDSGGPLIVESAGAGDVLVGVVSWAKDNACGREDYYGVYARVSSARAWIETITSGSCLS